MPTREFDLVAIGGGPAGLVTAAVSAGLGARTALVEKQRLGGECLWTGCVPSKALLHAAKVAHLARHAGSIGLELPPLDRSAARGVMDWVRESRLRVQEADAVEPMLRELGVEFLYGDGCFTSPREFRLGETLLRARHFVLATGSRPRIPEIPGLPESGYLTNVTVFDLPEPPESLLVLGGGPVGTELAQAFHRLGTRVTLLQRAPRLLPRDDEELVRTLEGSLRAEGIDLHPGAEVTRVERTSDGRRVLARVEGRELTFHAAELLVAVGRVAIVEGLGLDAAGVAFGEDGVRVDDCLRTTARGIWACGDVKGAPRLSHAAEYEAKVVVQNAFLPWRVRARLDRIPWTTFTDPELAHAGLTEAQARERGIPVEVFRHPFARDDRALVDNEPVGEIKLVARAGSGKLLGAQILGPRAGELIQEAVLALDRGLSVRHLADAVHVYPTLTVAVQRAAQHWWKARADQPIVRRVLRAWVRRGK